MARGRKDYEKAVIAVESEGFQNPHGRILMYDDFEDTPLKWDVTGNGINYETRQARAAYNGSYGLELDLTSDAPPTAQYAAAERNIPIDITERLLTELFWRANDLNALYELYIRLQLFTGAEYTTAWIGYVGGAQYWEYYNQAGGWAPIPNANQTFYDEAWNELTLSVDFSNNEYIIFKSNNLEVNMSGIPCRIQGSPAGAHANIRSWIINETSDRLITSIDDVIVRELEN